MILFGNVIFGIFCSGKLSPANFAQTQSQRRQHKVLWIHVVTSDSEEKNLLQLDCKGSEPAVVLETRMWWEYSSGTLQERMFDFY